MSEAGTNHERQVSADPSALGTYHLFGHILASDFSFTNKIPLMNGVPDLTFICVDESPFEVDSTSAIAVCTGSTHSGDPNEIAYLHQSDGCDVLSFGRIADFYVWSDRITCHLLDPAYHYMVEIYFLGTVMSFWLEHRGIPALHAAAAVVDGRAVAFLSSNSGGKSSLAASLMQIGCPLLSDDVLAVMHHEDSFVGLPGYPQMRFWPKEADYFLGHSDDLEIVHPLYSKRRVFVGPSGFGWFCDYPQPLACLYLPARHEANSETSEIEITPISLRDAVIELARHSFAASSLGGDMQEKRLDLFTRLVQTVPVRRLAYPSGLENLPRVRQALLQDLTDLFGSDVLLMPIPP